jgi:hypothetical protein
MLPAAGPADPDGERAVILGGKLAAGATITADDVATAEQILERHPAEAAARNLLESILVTISNQERLGQQHPRAVAHLRRALEVEPASRNARLGLLSALLESSDWPGAEAAARELVAREPRSLEGWRGLGFALMRQDRDAEAREALRAALEIREDASSRELYDRIVRSLVNQRGMTEQRISHFNVRYDGGQHEDVGREMLRALERHFATLARTFDHEPAATIPVVLFAQQSYYDATGAPFWSGGQYSHAEGRITIPIGGLTASLSPTLDRVLIHELAHAFIGDLSRGAAPREIQEGLAQYLEGKRVEDEVGKEGMRALAEGGAQSVMGFYLTSLAFVEQLVAERGQGGINDLLRAMGETGRVDDAFQRVYGRTFAESKQAFVERFRRQHAR